MNTKYKAMFLLLFLATFCFSVAEAQDIIIGGLTRQQYRSNSGTYLLNANSSRSFGMGDTKITDISAESGLFNPGTLALFHSDKTVSYSFPTNQFRRIFGSGSSVYAATGRPDTRQNQSGQILEGTIYDRNTSSYNASSSFSYTATTGISISKTFRSKITDKEKNQRIATWALGYFEVDNNYSYQEQSITTSSTKVLITSIGIESRVKFGIGASFKQMDVRNNMYDLGVYFEAPLYDIIKHSRSMFGILPSNHKLEMSIAVAYSSLNRTEEVSSSNQDYQTLFEQSRTPLNSSSSSSITSTNILGLSLKTNVKRNNSELFSIIMSYERIGGRPIVPDRSYPGVTSEEGVDIQTNSLRGSIGHYYGGELGILNSIYFRFGNSDGIKRIGYGLNIGQLLSIVKPNRTNSSNGNLVNYLANNLKMEIDWGKDYKSYRSGNLMKITLSL